VLETAEQKRLRVLFLPAWYPSEVSPLSGVFIREHARAASLYNDVVVMHAYHSPDCRIKGLYDVSDALEDGIRTIRIRYRCPSARDYSPISRALRLCSTFSYFCRFVRQGWRPDIIHAHVYSAAVTAVILGRVYGIPVVVTEHWTNFITRELTWERRLAAKFALNRAKAVLPVSHVLRQNLVMYGIRNNFQVVPNVVNTELFYPSSLERRNDGKRHLLLVATFVPRKGIPYLLKALNLVRRKRDDFVLDVVGDGPQRGEYEEMAASLDLKENVVFHGRKPEVHSFMQSCDFFVMPSLHENFGVVYIEAMACGKPVIASNIPGPNEFIDENIGILVPPKDVDTLAQAIDFMLDHHQDYSPEKIAAYARERFGYEAVGKQLDGIYREVVGR
jgi:glycosyltransferase involved in cell wall biosynthesis